MSLVQKLVANNQNIQECIEIANSLPNAEPGSIILPSLNNPAVAGDIVANKEAIDQNGEVIKGTIPMKTVGHLSTDGANVIVPAGYYPIEAVKSVETIARAETTISISADDINDTLTINAANVQGTGYVLGSNKTATKVVTLSASGATVTASDGTHSISKSVATTAQADPSINIDANGKIIASVTQGEGYVASGTKSASKQLDIQVTKTIVPTEQSQVAVAEGLYTIGEVTIDAIPDGYLVDAEVDEQTELINQIQAIIEAGGGNGSSKKTCTVTINFESDETTTSYLDDFLIIYNIIENGKVVSCKLAKQTLETCILENVVCGSTIVFIAPFIGYPIYLQATIIGDTQQIWDKQWGTTMVFQAPTTANATAIITLKANQTREE